VAERERACGCGYEFPATGFSLLGSKAARDIAARMRTPSPEKPPAKGRKKKSRGKRVSTTPDPGDSMSSKLIACPSCPAKISRRAERCPKCGKSPFSKCGICAAEIRANSAACPECGDPDPFNP
jgi:RNA polymerase subunit RPABC4/transcription elongation factor Spt4